MGRLESVHYKRSVALKEPDLIEGFRGHIPMVSLSLILCHVFKKHSVLIFFDAKGNQANNIEN